MAVFGLVHGVCAGGWCWELLTPYLEAAGHDVVAADLPCEDPAATFSDYAGVVDEALGSASEDVVLVGHSTGGLTIPLVAARRPVRELVFLCGLIPEPGRSAAEQGSDWRASDPAEWQIGHEDGSFSIRPGAMSEYVAQDADPEVAAGTVDRLRRQFLTPFLHPCPLGALPEASYRYILCREDRIVRPEWSRQAAPELLGIEAVELSGGHSPMASRPGELAEALLA
jgi:pimeloyl-ACP methyl ester carboxylesterase